MKITKGWIMKTEYVIFDAKTDKQIDSITDLSSPSCTEMSEYLNSCNIYGCKVEVR